MAGPTLAGDLAFDPQLATEYASSRFVENMALLSTIYGDILKVTGLDNLPFNFNSGGSFVSMPYIPRISSLLTKRDLTTQTPPTDLAFTGAEEKAVIVRRKAGPITFSEDIFTRGFTARQAEKIIGQQIADAAKLEARNLLISVLFGTMPALDTPGADEHILDEYAANGAKALLTFQRLADGRAKLGDAQLSLNTLIVHSATFADLVTDAIGNYKVENFGGQIVATGVIPNALGLRVIVMDHALLRIVSQGNYTKYRSFLLGPGALGLIYARGLSINAERRLDGEAPYWRILGNVDFAAHLFGMSYVDTGANPDATALETSNNWDEAYSDHREVLAAEIIHNATLA